MNKQATWSAAVALSIAAFAPLLEGCEKCSVNESPCADGKSFLMCTDRDASELRWIEDECPGIEPICRPEPKNFHSCHEGKPAPLCGTWRSVLLTSIDKPETVLQAADLNADGRTDLLVLMSQSPRAFRKPLVRVMQRADGSFDAPIEIIPDASSRVFFGDVDGDQRLDILSEEESRLVLRSGMPDGSFAEPVTSRSGAPQLSEVTDVDGDGTADLIGVLNDEIVMFGPPPQLTLRFRVKAAHPKQNPGINAPLIQDLDARDLDGDGRPELLAWATWKNPSDTPDWQKLQVFTRPDDAWMSDGRPWKLDRIDLHFADFNGDAIADRVSFDNPYAGRPRVFIATGDGGGKFDRQASQRLPEGGVLWFGDFDADGNSDIVSAARMISVVRGRGDGTLEPATSFRPPNSFFNGQVVADLDGDGALDLIGADHENVLVASRACLE